MYSENDITIRIAELKDAEQLVNLHLMLFTENEHVPVILGEKYIYAIYSWMLKSIETHIIVAELNNSIVGFISSCDSPYAVKMFLACLPDFIISILKSPGLIFSSILWNRVLRHFHQRNSAKKINHKNFGISQIVFGGINPNFRRLGIYSKINAYLKDFCRDRGICAIRSEVYKSNQSIRQYKENDGWIETPELETTNTVTYMYILDKKVVQEIGFDSLVSKK